MIKYPIGQSDFGEIRKGGFLYVDKTKYIHQLVSTGKYFFLSRPRRFGKSMLISTMECYFHGERELFKGLAIDSLEPEEWNRYPVLRLDFTHRGYNHHGDLRKALSETLDKWEKEFDAPNPDDSPDGRFNRLIWNVYERTGRQVVILIDEYDSPIVDVHGKPELEASNRKELHDFYRVMKANEKYLKFVFLTGVGKLGQINVFSGLNNLLDISLDARYSAICGMTTQEIQDYYHDGIQEFCASREWSYAEALRNLKDRYDGYHFADDLVDIYNPFSLNRALYYQKISDYWFQSGTPTRLVKQFLSNDWGSPDLEGTLVAASDLDSGDVLGNNLALACYYTGYLTIKSYDGMREAYVLGYPNIEVRNGFFRNLVETAKSWDSNRLNSFVFSLQDLIEEGDIDGFMHELQSFLAGIPYMNETNRESQWQKDILIIGRLIGMKMEVERRTSRGRMDMVLDSPKAIYIFEFKYGGTPEEALAQINDREYALQYENTLNLKPVFKVGVSISPETRNIDSWIIR